MDRGERGRAGGILGLRRYVDEHAGPLTFDLLERGYHLYDIPHRLSWWELKCVISWLPADSALARSIDPDWRWGLKEHLLASIADAARWLQWAKTQSKENRTQPPQLIPRPGVTPPELSEDERTIGGPSDALPLDEMAKWLGWDD